ncbi:hypothetical protein R82291_FJPPFKPJ_00700 [Fructobacillus cardui]|uniref:phage portal protein n=1 Tax=Fructobacillus cardui TaxID=2893170 RepID=UPI002D927A7C|nr:hypothetical protein R82291_FJPPFKPJ_00700 [Fructobacillus cardui]
MAKKTDSINDGVMFLNDGKTFSSTARVDENGVFYVKAFGDDSSWQGLKYSDLNQIISYHKNEMKNKYDRLFKYYKGQHTAIVDQRVKADFKPDNRLIINYPKQLVKAFSGYFAGVAPDISVTVNDDDGGREKEIEVANTVLKHFNRLNQIDKFYSEESKYVDIFGRAMAFVFQDEIGQTRLTEIDPRDGFIIYNDGLQKIPVFAVLYTGKTNGTGADLYDTANLYSYEVEVSKNAKTGLNEVNASVKQIIDFKIGSDINDSYIEFNDSVLDYGRLPMVEFLVDRERMGLYEDVMTIIDAIDSAMSEKKNDVDYFGDAFMKIINFKMSDPKDEDSADLRDKRIFEGRTDGDGRTSDIGFVEKPNADETQEHLINRLVQTMYDISSVVNLNDREFTNAASGTALKQRLQGMRQLANTKASSFQKSMIEIYRCFFNINGIEDMVDNIAIKPNYTEPIDLLDISQSLVNMMNVRAAGGISLETILSNIQIVKDAQGEMTKIELDRKTMNGTDTEIKPIMKRNDNG